MKDVFNFACHVFFLRDRKGLMQRSFEWKFPLIMFRTKSIEFMALALCFY